MKTLLLLLITIQSNIITPVHNVPVATFEIAQSEKSIVLNISFEVSDFIKSTKINANEITQQVLQKYMDNHTSFKFNGQINPYKISKFVIERDHIKIKGNFINDVQSVKNIKIENKCLINIHHHSNVIEINLNNQARDFKMNKDRTKIHVSY